MFRRSLRIVPLAVALAATPLLAGCPRTTTPAEIDQYGTRTYRGTTKVQTVKATKVALASLGYEVVLVDENVGAVKTAPKVMEAYAVGNAYHATAVQDSLAWSIDITSTPNGSLVRAHPRAYRNGQPIEPRYIVASFMQSTFDGLFHEIETNLPPGATPATAKTQ